MAKILMYADLHCHPHFGSFARVNNALSAVEHIYDIAVDRGIGDVMFLGDLFHDRSKINTYVYHQVYRRLKRYADMGIKTWFIIGNHDMYMRTSWAVNSVEPLVSGLGDCINEPQTININGLEIDCMPYVEHTTQAMVQQFPVGHRNRVLVGHIAIAGAVMNTLYGVRISEGMLQRELGSSTTDDLEEVRAGIFRGYEKVILGHLHSRQRIQTSSNTEIWYVGSPLQIHWGEAIDKKYCVILDTDTLELEWIENTTSPVHLLVPFRTMDDLATKDLSGNYVRLLVEDSMGSLDLIQLKREIQGKYDPRSLDIISAAQQPDTNPDGRDNSIRENIRLLTMNRDELIKFYVENSVLPKDLKKELLISIGMEIIQLSGVARNAH